MTNLQMYESNVKPELEELQRLVTYGLTETEEFIKEMETISFISGFFRKDAEADDENRWDSSHKKEERLQKGFVD